MENKESILFEKLDEFIKKYYINRIVKGVLLSILIIILYTFSISIIEYLSFLSIALRTFIFYSTVLLYLVVIVYFIVIPILKLFKIGKILDHKNAAEIISNHFPHLQDKLRNTLELIDLQNESNTELVIASINQRVEQFKPLKFVSAINFSRSRFYARILAVLLILLLPIFIFSPQIIILGTQRIIKHNTYFEPPMPFTIVVLNKNLYIEKGSDAIIKIKITGKYLPQNPEINIGNNSYFLEKESKNIYYYNIKSLNNSIYFYITADEFRSKKYEINVLPLPQLNSFTIQGKVPEYTGEKDLFQKDIGDIAVPEGTVLTFNINASDAQKVFIKTSDLALYNSKFSNNVFKICFNAKKSLNYSIVSSNSKIKNKKLISYNINVIPDLYPSIQIEQKQDSLSMFKNLVIGTIKDDYGFSNLQFVYYKNKNKDSIFTIPIQIDKNSINQQFNFDIDFSSFDKGNKIFYYFQVSDNDAVNGKKTTKSSLFEFSVPSKTEMDKIDKNLSNEIENDLGKSLKMAKDLKKEITNAQKKLLNQNLSSWEKSQLMKQIQDKHENLLQELQNIQKQNLQKNELSQFSNQDESIIEKQKAIEELLKSLMDDDLKKMLEEFKELTNKLNKEDYIKKTEDFKMNMEDVEKQLDRNLEMLKRMDIEKNLNNTLQDLKNLKENQDKLQNEYDKNNKEDNLNKQNLINDELKKIQEKYNDALKKNESLDKKMNLQDFNNKFEDTKNSMEESSKDIKNDSKNKSKKQMQRSSEKLDDIQQSMQSMIMKNKSQQQEEDESQLRQILDNLLTVSFEQEELEKELNTISLSDPKYISSLNKQIEITESFSLIKDSLYSLAKRQPSISKTVIDEIKNIKNNFNKIQNSYDERNTQQIHINQRFVMMHLNNLALMFAEILNNMQNQSQQKSGNPSQCKNPKNKGKGSPSMTEMKTQQQSFKQQLQKMIDQMKMGQNGKNVSQQLGKLLSQQEKFQQMLDNSIKNGGISPEATKQLQEIKKMVEQNQKDIINQNITPQTMFRQNQILTRLLEAETADNIREKDEKRESKTASNLYNGNKSGALKYNTSMKTFKEIIRYDNIKMNTYFKGKYDMYLLKINSR